MILLHHPALAYCFSMIFPDLPSPAEALTETTKTARASRRRETGTQPVKVMLQEPSLFRWTKRSPRADTIRTLYGVLVAQARRPAFHANSGRRGPPRRRFDMLLLP